MVVCNLAVLAAARGVSMSKISRKTGISRVTLSALEKNNLKGVQLDTIDRICMYLQVKIEELFSVYPFNIEVCSVTTDNNLKAIDIECIYTDISHEKTPFFLSGDYSEMQYISFDDLDKGDPPSKYSFSVEIDPGALLNAYNDPVDDEVERLFDIWLRNIPDNARRVIAMQIEDGIAFALEAVLPHESDELGDITVSFRDRKRHS